MPRTKSGAYKGTTMTTPSTTPLPAESNGSLAEVMALVEAATYLRLPEAEVLRLVSEQQLPGRQVHDDWRFLKAALQDWLRSPSSRKQGLLMQIGAFQDDPDLDDMLREISRQRGWSATEEG